MKFGIEDKRLKITCEGFVTNNENSGYKNCNQTLYPIRSEKLWTSGKGGLWQTSDAKLNHCSNDISIDMKKYVLSQSSFRHVLWTPFARQPTSEALEP